MPASLEAILAQLERGGEDRATACRACRMGKARTISRKRGTSSYNLGELFYIDCKEYAYPDVDKNLIITLLIEATSGYVALRTTDSHEPNNMAVEVDKIISDFETETAGKVLL